jgi:4-amino-4-deoxy-L-arabinose transferase-like glycosyltransferase
MTRLDAALAAVAAIAGSVAVAFTWQPGLASLFDDSVSYLILAQAFSPFGEASPAVAAAAAAEKYPPLLAWLIALAGGAFDWRLAHALVAVAFGASVFALGRLAGLATGSAATGLAAGLAYAFLPGAWLNVKGILAEFPYMAISFAALALHASWRARPATRGEAIVLGILVAGAFLARTIGVALLAALLAAQGFRWLRGREPARLRSLAWIAAIPLAAAALWYALRPSGGEDAYVAFGTQVAEDASRRGWDFASSLLLSNAAALRDAWLNALLIFWGEPWKPGFLLASAIGIAGLGATAWRALRFEADGLYCVAFLAILLAWPFPGQMYRLALPVVPLVLVHFLWAFTRLAERANPATASRRAPLGAVLPLVVCVPAVLFYIAPRAAAGAGEGSVRPADIAEFYRIPAGPSAEANARAQIGVFDDLRRIGETTPPQARVMWYWPNYVALLSGRHGVRLERPRDAADLAAQVRATRADYIYLAELHPRDSARRAGHPLDPAAHAAALGRVVWHRASAAGTMQAVLIEIDRRKVDEARPAS